jgi:hypothetical protein
LPNVAAAVVHELLDAVEAEVVGADDTYKKFVPPRAASPWLNQDGKWWPKPIDP